ncbi:MAG: fibronectin type III domain-containing protein [Burkholderiales bacterium]|nr:fibronectin type III domain-containing protein [Opitutaceae bacterium]
MLLPLRAIFALLMTLLGLGLGPSASVRAQSFTLGATALKVAVFSTEGYGYSYRSIAVQSTDPTFNPSSLSVSAPENTGVYPVLVDGGRTLRLLCYYSSGNDNTVKVTVRSATQTSVIAVSRVCFTKYRTPKVLLSPDKLRIYALYQDVILAFDARTRDLLASARFPLPNGASIAPDSGRSFSFSSDGSELHVFLSGFPTLFRFSSATLKSLASVPLPPPAGGFYGRFFAGERAGRLYFARYDGLSYGWSSYDKYYRSTLEVISFPEGKLLQAMAITPPTDAYNGQFHGENLALHPSRAELWMRERYRAGQWNDGVCLRRVPLKADGLISAIPSADLSLTTYYTGLTPDPWTDTPTRLLLSPNSNQVVVGSSLLEDASPDPVLVRTLPTEPDFLSGGDIAATWGSIVRLDTGETYPATIFSPSGEWTILAGLSSDGREVLTLGNDYSRDPTPVMRFIPEHIAALTVAKKRTPLDGSVVAPVSLLSWYPLPSPDRYRVYLSLAAADLEPALPASGLILGEPTGAALALPNPLPPGALYFWRVDAVYGDRVVAGGVQSFSVSHARVEAQPYETATVAGARRRDLSLPIVTSAADTAWQIQSDTPWLIVRSGSGVGSGFAELSIDAGSLPAGQQIVSLRLVTAEGAIAVVLRIGVLPLTVEAMKPLQGAARLVAVGPVAATNGVAERFLLSIDTANEQIPLCVAIPSDTLGIGTQITTTNADAPFYVLQDGITVGEFDPVTLALKRIIRKKPLPGEIYNNSIAELRPDGQGRLWLLDYSRKLALFDPARETYDLVCSVPVNANSATHFGETGTTLFTTTQDWDSTYGVASLTLRRWELQGQTFDLVAERVLPISRHANWHGEHPLQGLYPVRFSFLGVAYDDLLEPLADLEDRLDLVSDGGAVVLGESLLYRGSNYEEARVLPLDYAPGRACYEPVSGKLVYRKDGQPRFVTVDNLPRVVPVSLQTSSVSDTYAHFSWVQPPVAGEVPGYSRRDVIQYRKAGSDGPWGIDGFWSVDELQPETTYEARGRAYDFHSPISGWSELIRFTTTVARPVLNHNDWPQPQGFAEGAVISFVLPVAGKDLIWDVKGLPAGLIFNAATRTLEGVAGAAGAYSIEFTARNAAGSVTQTVLFRVFNTSSALPSARYTGLLELDGGPLMGIWQASRSGDKITGTYRSALFIRSFKATFGAPSLVGWPSYSLCRTATCQIVYQGVPIYLTLIWNLDTDRLRFYAGTADLEENFYADTTPETGLASHWAAPALSHPAAGLYTALLVPGEGTGPEGSGFFSLTLPANGLASIKGETALGQKFTQSLPISDRHSLPFFYYSGITLALGEMELTDAATPAPRLVGELVWAKDTDAKANSYRDGFEQQLLVIGVPLPANGKKLPPLNPLANSANRAEFTLSGGGLGRLSKPIEQTLTPTTTGFTAPKPGTPDNLHRVAVKLDGKTGLVTGSVAILDATGKKVVRTQGYRAMCVKDPLGDGKDVIGGYFLLPDEKKLLQSGRIEITEPDSP